MISRPVRPYLRLIVVGFALVPLALIARACYSTRLVEFVQRTGAREWKRWDKTRGRWLGR